MAPSASIVVSEVFGPTLQGEGPTAGRRAAFVRLGRCNLDCNWCFAPETPVLMADWTTKPIGEIRAGDLVVSYRKRRYETTVVESVLRRRVPETVLVRADDLEIRCTGDHVFATPHHLDGRRRAPAKEMTGRHLRVSSLDGWPPAAAIRSESWWRGWAMGLIAGDGHIGTGKYPKVFLQITDRVLADTYCEVLNAAGSTCSVRECPRRTVTGKVVYRVSHVLGRAPWLVRMPRGEDEIRGWLAGFFDAEGSTSRGQLHIAQASDKMSRRVISMLSSIGIRASLQEGRGARIDGVDQMDRFFAQCRPVLERKISHRHPNRMLRAKLVTAVETAPDCEVINLSTASGYFFANRCLVEQCDSAFTWDWDRFDPSVELREMSVDELVRTVEEMQVDRVVITGGEPLLQQRRLLPFLEVARQRGWSVEIETNGTLMPTVETTELVTAFNVSPKLENSGVSRTRAIAPQVLSELRATGKAVFKFVVSSPGDLDEVAAIVEASELRPVWIMPEGTDSAEIRAASQSLADAVINRGWNLSDRLQVHLWGDERGR